MKIVPKIKIVGVGGAGNNTLARLRHLRLGGVESLAVNTDAQDLKKTSADKKLRIGRQATQGLGTGMNPDLGRLSAQEQSEEIKSLLAGSDLVFLAAGLGGGTGSGAGPVVAEISRGLGILTVGVVTQPFSFEGPSRASIAQESLKNLEGRVDSLVVLSNDRLLGLVEKNTSLTRAFLLADEILFQAVNNILELILKPSLVALSFADVRAVLKDAGRGFFGQGQAQGENRSSQAVAQALNSPLLNIDVSKARRMLFNIVASHLKLTEVESTASLLTKNLAPGTKVVFGAREDQSLKSNEMKIALIATGF